MHEVGSAVRLTWRVLDPSRTRVDADVTVAVTPPSGDVLTPSPERVDVGDYAATFVPTVPGRYVVRWAAAGPVTLSRTEIVNVRAAAEPVALISLGQLKEHLNKEDLAEDDELLAFIDTASLVVEEYTGQVWARRTLTEDVWVTGGVGYLRPPVVEVLAVVGVATIPAVDSFTGALAVGGAPGMVRVTYVAGPPEVPEHVQTATAIVAAHLWTTQRPPTPGVAFGGGELVAATPGRGYLIPNQAAQLLGGKAPNRP